MEYFLFFGNFFCTIQKSTEQFLRCLWCFCCFYGDMRFGFMNLLLYNDTLFLSFAFEKFPVSFFL